MDPKGAEAVVAAVGARRHGIVTTPLLLKAGLTKAALHHQVADGRLVGLGRCVYRLRDHPWTWESRLRAALDLAGPRAVVCLRSAARLHGFWVFRATIAIEVWVPHGNDSRAPAWVRIRRTRAMPDRHVVIVGGFPTTSVARTAFDLAGDRDPRVRKEIHALQIKRIFNDAMARRGLGFMAEVAVLADIGKRGRTGTRLVREILLEFGPKYVPTHSEAESLFAEFLKQFELEDLERQQPLSDAQGFVRVADFLQRRLKLDLEVDSGWHDGPLDEIRDHELDERLRAAGYTIRRIRSREIVVQPRRLAAELCELGVVATVMTVATTHGSPGGGEG